MNLPEYAKDPDIFPVCACVELAASGECIVLLMTPIGEIRLCVHGAWELARQLMQSAEGARCDGSAHGGPGTMFLGAKKTDDRERKHPMAPDRCPICNWTNINLMNFGTTGESKWMCHGCAARVIQRLEIK